MKKTLVSLFVIALGAGAYLSLRHTPPPPVAHAVTAATPAPTPEVISVKVAPKPGPSPTPVNVFYQPGVPVTLEPTPLKPTPAYSTKVDVLVIDQVPFMLITPDQMKKLRTLYPDSQFRRGEVVDFYTKTPPAAASPSPKKRAK